MTDTVITHPENKEPTEFTLAILDWLPWLRPPEEAALTERQHASLVDAARSKSAYFRLLARDPDILEARTRTDKDIFYTPAPACRVPNANCPRRRLLAITVVSTARRFTPAIP